MRSKVFKIIKNIVCSALFLSILSSVLCYFSYFFRFEENEKATEIIKGFYALDENTTDIVFIGGSSFYRAVSAPKLYNDFGYTSYIFAAPSFYFDAAESIIRSVRRTQNPSLYVLDIRRFYKRAMWEITGETEPIEKQRSRMSYIVNNMPLSPERAMLIHKFYNEKVGAKEIEWQFDYLRTHNNWKERTPEDFKNFLKETLNYKTINKHPYYGTISCSTVVHFDDIDLSQYKMTATISDELLEPLNETLDYIRKNNLNVLFMSPPYPISEKYYAYEKFVGEYLEARGFNFLSGNEKANEIGVDFYTDFYDDEHVNALGSEKFTTYLGNYIKQNYDIKNVALTESQQKDWERAYNEWNSNVLKPYLEKILKKCE
ncbi:MAG: hypothetical protein ACI4GA_01935 [Acutalibacteraceae bacterium]|nr:hypothetical protein [Oscillospiraceae bacterium]